MHAVGRRIAKRDQIRSNIPEGGAGRGAGRPDSPPFRTHRAQFGQ